MQPKNITWMQTILLVFYFLITVITVMMVYVILDLYKKRHLLKFGRNLNIYKFYPIIGNGLQLLQKTMLEYLEEIKMYLPCTFWIGHECNYITADPEEIKVILNHPNAFDRNKIYDNFHNLFGGSLLFEKYEEWKRDRKIFSKSFTQQMLNGFVKTFYEKSCVMVEALSANQLKDKSELFIRYSLGSFCVNGSGENKENNDIELTQIFNRLHISLANRITSGHLFPECIWKYTQQGRTFFKDKNEIRQFINTLIQKKKKELMKRWREHQEDANNFSLLDLMLENEDKIYSDEDIYNQFNFFMLAAIDTSGLTLSFTFTLLGMNPEAQEKLYQEVRETVGIDRPICHSDLPNLKYTERAILETLRIFPVIPAIGRRTTADIDLGTRILPAGINVVLFLYHLHRSEKYWTNPLQYDPERFLPEEMARQRPYTFVPFSRGPQICMGMKYALMSIKIAVANVIRNYRVVSNYTSVEDIKLRSAVTMKAKHDLDCKFIPRKQSKE